MKPVEPNGGRTPTSQGAYDSLARYPLLDALPETPLAPLREGHEP
jgi:hypothetical protein